eukprot:2475224-Rhodomonas_salina.3
MGHDALRLVAGAQAAARDVTGRVPGCLGGSCTSAKTTRSSRTSRTPTRRGCRTCPTSAHTGTTRRC